MWVQSERSQKGAALQSFFQNMESKRFCSKNKAVYEWEIRAVEN